MKTKLQVAYHVDRLSIVYEIPPTFMGTVQSGDPIFDFVYGNTPTVFIFRQKYSRVKRKVLTYILSFKSGVEEVIIGEFRNDIECAITLDVDNRFLYSDQMHLLHRFEVTYGLKFMAIKNLDVCCDSNHNLPRKLNTMMHSSDCEVSRRGGKRELTDKGNQRLGTKIMDNLKTLTTPERVPVSYYFYLNPSGCRRPVILRGYDKAYEIKHVSHKKYISDSLGYASGRIHRLEVSTYWTELTIQSNRKNGWSHRFIYDRLNKPEFLREFFIRYLNRFNTLTIKGKKMKLSEFLCLGTM